MARFSSLDDVRSASNILQTRLRPPTVHNDHATYGYYPLKAENGTSSSGISDEDKAGPSYYCKFSEWKWESLAWMLGTIIIIGTVVMLSKFNNKLVNEWPLPIRINTMVAFLAQVAQSALLVPTEACISQLKWLWLQKSRKSIHLEQFDAASRGPWGSAMLILGLSPTPRLVHFGALITIFMLVFSTFFQQAVQIQLEPLEISTVQQATVPRLRKYLRPTSKIIYSDGFLYANDFGSDAYLSNTISSGLLASSQNISDVRAFCPTGQCAWKPYTTLAICHSIEDVSSQLTTQKAGIVNDWVALPGIIVAESTIFLTLWLSTIFGNGMTTIGSRGQEVNITDSELKSPDSSLDDLAHIYLAYQDPCLIKNQSRIGTESWRALKSTVKLCLQTLNTSYNGSTDTTIIRSYSNLTWVAQNDQNDPGNRIGNWTTSLKNIDDQLEEFTFPFETAEMISGQIAMSLNFSASMVAGGDNYLYGSNFASNFVADILGGDPSTCSTSQVLGVAGFDKRIGIIATALTNAFRTSNGSIENLGTSSQAVQFIHVAYWTLGPPAALLVAITIFFLATVVCTTKIPVWKSSQLAVLYTLHEPAKLGTKRAMEKQAKQTSMRFRTTGNWQLEHT